MDLIKIIAENAIRPLCLFYTIFITLEILTHRCKDTKSCIVKICTLVGIILASSTVFFISYIRQEPLDLALPQIISVALFGSMLNGMEYKQLKQKKKEQETKK